LKFRRSFARFADRAGIYIVVVCTIACAVDVYVLNRTQRFTYEFYSAFTKIEDAVAQLTIALTELGLPPSEIVPPVDFLYVDAERVATLYSEIEPSLVEQKRTLTQESKKDKGVDLERQPLTLKLGGSTATKESREFKAVDPSTARKCLDLMNGLLARQAPPYYATFAQFGTFQTLMQAKDSMKSIHETLQQPSLVLIEVPQGKSPS
jgi:hypothetical protein